MCVDASSVLASGSSFTTIQPRSMAQAVEKRCKQGNSSLGSLTQCRATLPDRLQLRYILSCTRPPS